MKGERGWDVEKYGSIRTYVAVVDGVGMAFPTEFLLEFRKWSEQYPNSREQGFDFALMDASHIDMINKRLMSQFGVSV